MKDIPVCAQVTPLQSVDAVIRPDFERFNKRFVPPKNWTVDGNELSSVMIRISQRQFGSGCVCILVISITFVKYLLFLVSLLIHRSNPGKDTSSLQRLKSPKINMGASSVHHSCLHTQFTSIVAQRQGYRWFLMWCIASTIHPWCKRRLRHPLSYPTRGSCQSKLRENPFSSTSELGMPRCSQVSVITMTHDSRYS